jgi:hypothetical protein
LSRRTEQQQLYFQQLPSELRKVGRRALRCRKRLVDSGLQQYTGTAVQLEAEADRMFFGPSLTPCALLYQAELEIDSLGALGEPLPEILGQQQVTFLVANYKLFTSAGQVIQGVWDQAHNLACEAERAWSSNRMWDEQVLALTHVLGGLWGCLGQAHRAANLPLWAHAERDGLTFEGVMPSYHAAVSHLWLAAAWVHVKVQAAMRATAAALMLLLPGATWGPVEAAVAAWLDPEQQHSNPLLDAVLGLEPELSLHIQQQFAVGHQAVAIAAAAMRRTPWAVQQRLEELAAAGPPLEAAQLEQLQFALRFHEWARLFTPAAERHGSHCFATHAHEWPTLGGWVQEMFGRAPPSAGGSPLLLEARDLCVAGASPGRMEERVWMGALTSNLPGLNPRQDSEPEDWERLEHLEWLCQPNNPKVSEKLSSWLEEFRGLQQQHLQGAIRWAARIGCYAARQQRELLELFQWQGATSVTGPLLVAATLLSMQILMPARLLGSSTAGPLMEALQRSVGHLGLSDTAGRLEVLSLATRPVYAPAWLEGLCTLKTELDPEATVAGAAAGTAQWVSQLPPLSYEYGAAAAAADRVWSLGHEWRVRHALPDPLPPTLQRLHQQAPGLPHSINSMGCKWPETLSNRWHVALRRVQQPNPVVEGIRGLAWGAGPVQEAPAAAAQPEPAAPEPSGGEGHLEEGGQPPPSEDEQPAADERAVQRQRQAERVGAAFAAGAAPERVAAAAAAAAEPVPVQERAAAAAPRRFPDLPPGFGGEQPRGAGRPRHVPRQERKRRHGSQES